MTTTTAGKKMWATATATAKGSKTAISCLVGSASASTRCPWKSLGTVKNFHCGMTDASAVNTAKSLPMLVLGTGYMTNQT